MVRRGFRWTLALATLFLVGCDHATKIAARDVLGLGRVVTLVSGWLDLRYTENFDTAFSLTRGWSGPAKGTVLVVVMLATIAALVVVALRRRARATDAEQVGFALVLAGAVGNALDRVWRGYVVDFIHLHHWPVFNVADILVVVGVVVLCLSSFGRREAGARSPPRVPLP